MMLLERERFLETLREALASARRGDGRLALVSGEAGVGKTSLVRAFCASVRDDARVLEGACEPLFTPRPLGPFSDVAAETGGALEDLVTHGARAHEVLRALLTELRARPTVLVLEDLHWADEATLDVLRLLGRRVEGSRAVVIVTYRDDELDRNHPLRVAIGGLGSLSAIRRLRLPPLSVDAVRDLARPHGFDADELHRRTGGNPFFVTELLGSGEDGVPPTVREAVLARAAQLALPARRLLEAVAVAPAGAELWLLETIAVEIAHLDECVAAGMLHEQGELLGFRHELARLAVESATPPARRRALHRAIVAALADAPEGAADDARVAHHAEAAGDGPAALRHAVPAAERAASMGAHREAAAQYARALRFSTGLDARAVAELLERRSRECSLTGQIDEALAARTEALALYRRLGDPLREGDQLCWLSRLYWFAARRDDADEAARAAVELLEALPPGPELARAYSTMASRRSIALDPDGAAAWGDRALPLAEELGEMEIVIQTLNTVGTVEGLAGRGADRLRQALQLALAHGFDGAAALGYGNLAVVAARRRDWREADRLLDEGIRYTTARDLDADRTYLLAWRSWAALPRARWDDAAADVTAVLREPGTPHVVRASALSSLGLLRARRGDPGVWEPLDEALEIARAAAEHPKLAPVAVARAEAALLGGDATRAAAEAGAFVLDELVDRWIAGELAVLKRRAAATPNPARDTVSRAPSGRDVAVGDVPEPFALELAGDHAAAAASWRELGCPYDAALALAWSSSEEDLRRAHEELRALGARPAAALVARRLRELGATGLARGPRPATRANAGGLTAREVEVLALVADGLQDAEIATRLFLSPRTVGHHVSAILRKLDARTRGQAAAAGRRLGLVEAGTPDAPR